MKDQTDITIVLDRSGSMASIREDTIGGFNQFLKSQRHGPDRAVLTLHLFDHLFETPIKGQDVNEAEDLTDATFVPRGNTALLDAIGKAIDLTGKRLSKTPAKHVIFVILTDGFENASRDFSTDKIQHMIDHQRDKYSWEFVFLGANQDAITTAAQYGIRAGNAMTYAHNAVGTQAAYAAVGSNLRAMRAGQSAGVAFSDKQREAQKKAGA